MQGLENISCKKNPLVFMIKILVLINIDTGFFSESFIPMEQKRPDIKMMCLASRQAHQLLSMHIALTSTPRSA